ncbi:hypothetical protein CVT26_010582 [Gymnopilus dilepis]|uniref:Rho-GAP domain-containing protein n=1 Tax=Gymnopilus dilepis TaxID=231916 RepID=A0A409VZK6_9AGAR|nr:hypothetical protein CVT26_010582 [Gymnopilus dilepis]
MKPQGAPLPSSDVPHSTHIHHRAQRPHRHSAIPALFRHKASQKTDQHPSQNNDIAQTLKRMDPLKKQSYSLLSVANPSPQPSPGLTPASRRRFVSMPQALPSEGPTRVDIDSDRLSRAMASPPLVDFTQFEDTYRGPRTGNFEGLMASTSRSRSGMRSSSSGIRLPSRAREPSPATASADTNSAEPGASLASVHRKPDPRLILEALRDVLGSAQTVEDRLDALEHRNAHQLDQQAFGERQRAKTLLLEVGKVDVQDRQGPLVVLGEPLRKSWVYSSTTHALGGRNHELPVLVVHCVEELYRTGIFQPNLFRTLPNRFRLLELINIFDFEQQLPGSVIRSRQRPVGRDVHPRAGFGFNTSLHLESTPDICALLTTYLSSLPEPLLPPYLFHVIWDWCDIAHDDEDMSKQRETFGARLSPIPMARTYTNPRESSHILIAQLLLHLLPSPNFSLLVYLLAFFSQVALVKEENGVGVQDLGRMFGARLFGSGVDNASPSPADKGKGKAKANDGDPATSSTSPHKGEKMMCWFLRRWTPIFEGLFDVVEEAQMGVFRPPVMRKDSLGKDVLKAWRAQVGGDDGSDDEDDVEDQREEQREGDGVQDVSFTVVSPPKAASTPMSVRPQSSGSSAPTPIPRIRIQASPPQSHSTPKHVQPAKGRPPVRSMERKDFLGADKVDDFGICFLVIILLSAPDAFCLVLVNLNSDIEPVIDVPASDEHGDHPDETLDLAAMQARALSSSTYPGSPQQAGDASSNCYVSLPALSADETLPSTVTQTPEDLTPPSERNVKTREYSDRGVQAVSRIPGSVPFDATAFAEGRAVTTPSSEQSLRKALQIIADLEKQLKDRTECLTDSLKDLARCKLELEACRRQVEVRKLESILS